MVCMCEKFRNYQIFLFEKTFYSLELFNDNSTEMEVIKRITPNAGFPFQNGRKSCILWSDFDVKSLCAIPFWKEEEAFAFELWRKLDKQCYSCFLQSFNGSYCSSVKAFDALPSIIHWGALHFQHYFNSEINVFWQMVFYHPFPFSFRAQFYTNNFQAIGRVARGWIR